MKLHPFPSHSSLLIGFALFPLLSGSSWAAAVLSDFQFSGPQQYVSWEAPVGSGGGLANGGALSRDNANPGVATAGVGTIGAAGGAYFAGAGYYNFSPYALTVTTSIQPAAGFTDIQNVVFQRVVMVGKSTDGSSLDPNIDLNWNGAGGPTLALDGPWLSYYDSSDHLLGRIQAAYKGIGENQDIPSATPGLIGGYFSLVYQWDLSFVPEDVASVRVDAPVTEHGSTPEVRLDIGQNFVQVIPEPSSFLLGGIGLASALRRRR